MIVPLFSFIVVLRYATYTHKHLRQSEAPCNDY
jgi:hypothetical protein